MRLKRRPQVELDRQRQSLGINCMTTEIRVPRIPGAEGKLSIGRWFKRTGDAVTVDEPLLEINTGTVAHEVVSPATGVLSETMFRDGASVEAGILLGTITQF
jgi:pyruvate/2-oxoglutarate dehydrogenase complex dihydrolipoamide acyltransferase (E2) component